MGKELNCVVEHCGSWGSEVVAIVAEHSEVSSLVAAIPVEVEESNLAAEDMVVVDTAAVGTVDREAADILGMRVAGILAAIQAAVQTAVEVEQVACIQEAEDSE